MQDLVRKDCNIPSFTKRAFFFTENGARYNFVVFYKLWQNICSIYRIVQHFWHQKTMSSVVCYIQVKEFMEKKSNKCNIVFDRNSHTILRWRQKQSNMSCTISFQIKEWIKYYILQQNSTGQVSLFAQNPLKLLSFNSLYIITHFFDFAH